MLLSTAHIVNVQGENVKPESKAPGFSNIPLVGANWSILER